jgi:mycofactocin system glycosyltransferase
MAQPGINGQIRYKLNHNVRLLHRDKDGFIISTCPFTVRKVKKAALELLELCDGERALNEILSQLSQPVRPEAAFAFLEKLAAAEVICAEYPAPAITYPYISVVVPVRNRPEQIGECLRSLLSLDYPTERREIIVVDDASTDSTPEKIACFPVRRIFMPQPGGPAACRNRGAREASGELIAFIDSDCVADPNWLRELVSCFNDPRVGAAGGIVEPLSRDSLLQKYEAVKSPLYQGAKPRKVQPSSPVSYLAGCNLLVRKEIFEKLGGFDEKLRFGEDVDFIWRLSDQGYKVLYLIKGRVRHQHPREIWTLAQRRALYATSEAPLSQKHPGKGKRLYLPLGLTGCLGLFSLGLLLKSGVIFAAALLPPLIELTAKEFRLFRVGLPFLGHSLLAATLRNYIAALHHVLRILSRYYLLLLLSGGIVFPPLLTLGLLAAIIPALTDYFRLKPKLPLPAFAAFHLVENLSYQVGVLLGCLKHRTLRPLIPVIKLV